MEAPANNLFLRLHKWAARQDENFLTESLAVVVEHLLVLAPDVGARLVNLLTGGFLGVHAEDAGAIQVRTQVETGEGRPDLELSMPDRLAWIEVKAESSLRTGQLEGYRVLLARQGVPQTRLILLTRYAEEFRPEQAPPDKEVRWFEFADWLENELPAAEAAGAVAGFLARQFLDFLGTRGMTLNQVSKYMPEGLRAWGNMLNMLVEAAAACKVAAKTSASLEYTGVKIDAAGRKYWVGTDYTTPDKLCFGTSSQIDPKKAAELGVGELTEENWVPGRNRWWRCVELDSESIHFFSLSKVKQMEWLIRFLRESLELAHRIETPDQPPSPEAPEED
jgi:hypothetical protein